MKALTLAMLGSMVMLAFSTFTASTASAAIVCNREGDCWHVRGNVRYQPGLNLRIFPDNWRWRAGDHYRWREHEGRGFWRNGVWVDIQ